jgi:TIR domain
MPSVFLSHSKRDTQLAAGIARELRGLGIVPSGAMGGSAVRRGWRQAVKGAIRGADAFVLVVGAPEAASSSWVGYELGMAEAWSKPILILLSHNRMPDELPPDMSELPVVAFDPEQPERAARDIVDRLLAAA